MAAAGLPAGQPPYARPIAHGPLPATPGGTAARRPTGRGRRGTGAVVRRAGARVCGAPGGAGVVAPAGGVTSASSGSTGGCAGAPTRGTGRVGAGEGPAAGETVVHPAAAQASRITMTFDRRTRPTLPAPAARRHSPQG